MKYVPNSFLKQISNELKVTSKVTYTKFVLRISIYLFIENAGNNLLYYFYCLFTVVGAIYNRIYIIPSAKVSLYNNNYAVKPLQ